MMSCEQTLSQCEWEREQAQTNIDINEDNQEECEMD